VIAVLVFSDGVRPQLVSDTIRARGALLQVRYAFNEPVRAFLVVNGRRATAASSLRKSGALVWRRRGNRRSVQIAIEGTDRSGRHAIVRLNRARAATSARPRVVT
jgi:hypothetical protein